jgi:hypothetical protein
MAGARTLQRGLEVLAACQERITHCPRPTSLGSTGLDRAVIGRLLPPLVEAGFVATGVAASVRGRTVLRPVGPGWTIVTKRRSSRTSSSLRSDSSDDTEGSDSGDATGWDGLGRSRIPIQRGSDLTSTPPDRRCVLRAHELRGRHADGTHRGGCSVGEMPVSFVGMMGDVEIDDLGPDYGTIIERMCDIDPAAAFRVFLAGLSERDQDILPRPPQGGSRDPRGARGSAWSHTRTGPPDRQEAPPFVRGDARVERAHHRADGIRAGCHRWHRRYARTPCDALRRSTDGRLLGRGVA